MTVTVARWTLGDYHALAMSGLLQDRPVELLNGLIVNMPPEGPDHAELSSTTSEVLGAIAAGRYRVRSGKPITLLGSDSEPEPDVALVVNQSYLADHPRADQVYLVIEFSRSSLLKDTKDKRQVYAAAGIRDYWVVNLRDRTLTQYRDPVDGDYQVATNLTTGSVSPLAFPDIQLAVPQFFS